MGLFGRRRGRDDRVGLGGHQPARGPQASPPASPADSIPAGFQNPLRERCPRDSDWCDGEICKQYGIDCPNADKGAEMTS